MHPELETTDNDLGQMTYPSLDCCSTILPPCLFSCVEGGKRHRAWCSRPRGKQDSAGDQVGLQ